MSVKRQLVLLSSPRLILVMILCCSALFWSVCLYDAATLSSLQVKVCRLLRGELRSSSPHTADTRLSSAGLCLIRVFKMKRRQKRVLQMAFLFMVALIFLPNVGLWSMYREKSLMKSHEPGEQVSTNLWQLCDSSIYRLSNCQSDLVHAASSFDKCQHTWTSTVQKDM